MIYMIYTTRMRNLVKMLPIISEKTSSEDQQTLDKRCNYITFNFLGYECLDECFEFKDHSLILYEMLAHYK